MPPAEPACLKTRLRVVMGAEDAFGPGKAQLLESLLKTGSLNRSASSMKMSYVKALSLVKAMNEHFNEPLVVLTRGGKQGGGTQVTEAGRKVLTAYHAMREASERAAETEWSVLRGLLKQ